MLSKALQKANTAVLLDNAANFEGAIEAYDDACQLLQMVMLRSNGSVEEKLKLQEIVSKLYLAHPFSDPEATLFPSFTFGLAEFLVTSYLAQYIYGSYQRVTTTRNR